MCGIEEWYIVASDDPLIKVGTQSVSTEKSYNSVIVPPSLTKSASDKQYNSSKRFPIAVIAPCKNSYLWRLDFQT